MKQDLSKLLDKINFILVFVKRHNVTLFIVFFLGIYSLLIYQINIYINSEPSAQQLDEQISKSGKISIDQESIDRLLELEEQNIEIKALFEQARDNPFNE